MAQRKRFSVHDLYPENYCFDYDAFETDPGYHQGHDPKEREAHLKDYTD